LQGIASDWEWRNILSELQFQNPGAIVSTEWLEPNLSSPGLRIFDCTTYLQSTPGSHQPYKVISGRDEYNRDHLPGSGFLDLQGDLSDSDSPFLFTVPSAERLAEAFGQQGIGDASRVILYSRKNPQWATRLWWMLRYIGFDDAAILDGGWDKWTLEGRETSSVPVHFPPASLTARPRHEVFVAGNAVQEAIDDPQVCTINALSPDLHSGENSRYGRPGRIPGSVNVPATPLIDPVDATLPTPEVAAAAFDAVGVKRSRRFITYCGGGIWASMDAFLLHQLGYEDVAVYDNSMSEWARDESLPMETDWSS
jgi:thiosulfate/3-mercaptopyruvate sulfurtransferase